MGKHTEKFQTILHGLVDRPYIPAGLRLPRRLILHISDTPMEIYPFLFQVIQRLQPVDIIHTGDLADKYKIEFQKYHLADYQHSVSIFLRRLKKISGASLHITLGNHDDQDTLATLLPGKPMEARTVYLHGKAFHLMHTLEQMPKEPGYYCFGHKFKPPHEISDRIVLLNGILHMNVIDIDNWQVFHLEYPMGTNKFRKMTRGRIGL